MLTLKAKDYFEKYEQSIIDPQSTDEARAGAASNLLLEMCTESQTVLKKRNAQTGTALMAIIKEFNQKWNAICRMFESKYGESPLIRDGFKNFWFDRMPELKFMFEYE